MTLPDIDPEDKLIFPDNFGSTPNLFSHIPGGAVTVSILVLTAVASFGLGMLADHNIEGQKGLTGSSASASSALTAPGVSSQDSAAKNPNGLNTALPNP